MGCSGARVIGNHHTSCGPLYSTRRLLPWLQPELRDGGYLLSDEKAFYNAHGPRVIVQQDSNTRGRIFNERERGIIVTLKESSDDASDTKLVNIIIIMSAVAYFVDTIIVLKDKDKYEKYDDAFGNLFVEWWDKCFRHHEPPDSTPLRYLVSVFVTGNNYYIGAFKRHWAPGLQNPSTIRCIAHVLNVVGGVFWDHASLSILREFMSKLRAILQGKNNIRRRHRFCKLPPRRHK